MAVFMIENVAETTHQEAVERPESARLTVSSQWDVRFDDTVATRTDLGKWTFIWYGEANTKHDFKRVVGLLASDHLAELLSC
jgi:hypothetical protein